jgi:citrate synthase
MPKGEAMAEETWTQPVTSVEPNRVALRGYPIDQLMGSVAFGEVVFLALTGELPPPGQGRVMDAILVSSVDHGATPPSALAARTVASSGAPLTTGIAAGVMAINRFHGGAIEGCMRVLSAAVDKRRQQDQDAATTAREVVAEYRAQKQRIPGYGHRIHSDDPRTRRLFAIAEEVGVAGEYTQMAQAIQRSVEESLGRALPLNVDGAIAALLCEMGFPPEIGNGLFAIARTVGLTAHVYDEITSQRPMRRISPTAHAYSGPPERQVPPFMGE